MMKKSIMVVVFSLTLLILFSNTLHAEAAASKYKITEKVNIRVSPTNLTTLTILNKGEIVTGSAEKNVNKKAWLQIQWKGISGWIPSSYAVKQPVNEQKIQHYYKAKVTLNIRKTGSMNGKKIGSLKANTIVYATKMKDGWLYIPALKGWVYSDNLTLEKDLAKKAYVIEKQTNLYAASSTTAQIVAILPKNIEVSIKKSVKVKNIEFLYVENDFIKGWIVNN